MSTALTLRAALASALLLPLAGEARDGIRVPANPQYQQECAACHVAYPPGALPAASWRRLMQNLPHHFGTDASLDPATVRQLSAWLDRYAATGRRAQEAPAEDRITRTAWFQRKHDEIAPRTWQLPKVKSPANCAACHIHAPQGVFDEHDVHIPR